MPEYLAPGVYVEELEYAARPMPFSRQVARSRLAKPVDQVRSSWTYSPEVVAAFVGLAPAGPGNTPVLVTNWTQYVRTFSAYDEYRTHVAHLGGAYLSHAVFGYFENGGTRCYVTRVLPRTPVANPSGPSPAEFVGNIEDRSGLAGLQNADDVNVVCCPDVMAAYQSGSLTRDGVKAVQLSMINHCELMGNRMAILDALPGLSAREVSDWRRAEAAYDSKYAALYYPWIAIAGPDGRPLEVPPSGHIAGIWARNDVVRGIHKAPAEGIVRGALGVDYPVVHEEQDILNPLGVNVVRAFPGRGVRVWGARTLSSDPSARFIQHRRLLAYIQESVRRGTDWAVFESLSDRSIWAQLEYDIGEFLKLLWQSGALQGGSPEEAYFVRCDDELNPPDTLDRAQLHVEVEVHMHMGRLALLRFVYHA